MLGKKQRVSFVAIYGSVGCFTTNDIQQSEGASPKLDLPSQQTSLGSAHVPNALDAEGFPISEAQASAQYLIRCLRHPPVLQNIFREV